MEPRHEEVFEMLMHWAGYGWGGPWFLIFPLFWVVVALTALYLFRRRGPAWHRTSSAEDILAERYARGEISVEEYRQRLDVLQRKEA
jgi:putative membrane protein